MITRRIVVFNPNAQAALPRQINFIRISGIGPYQGANSFKSSQVQSSAQKCSQD